MVHKVSGAKRKRDEHKGLAPGLKIYLKESRKLWSSMLMVLPLFVLYQLGVLTTSGVRNGVDFVTSWMWVLAQGQKLHYMIINGLILLIFGVVLWARRHQGAFRLRHGLYVCLESVIYAAFFGSAVIKLMSFIGLNGLLASGALAGEYTLVQKLVLSLGAGFYEELVFRLIGMGGLYLVLTRVFHDIPAWVSAVIAVLCSSLVFSAIHHVGALGDPFTLGVFMFRMCAGVLLALIFALRGFAVAVYTHAIYDIIVLVFNP